MRSKFLAAAAVCVLMAGCGSYKSGQANSSQGNISKDSRPQATANASQATPSNDMVMLAVPSVSGAQAAAIMHERHEGMESIGNNFKTLHRELDSSSPNIATVRSSAAAIAGLSKKASGWFPAGTGPDVGKTGAKPDIWLPQNQSDFAAKLAAFQKAAQVFNAAAVSGDVNAIKARYAELGGACKACHDKYRAEMHH
jgi:cytochrome c556